MRRLGTAIAVIAVLGFAGQATARQDLMSVTAEVDGDAVLVETQPVALPIQMEEDDQEHSHAGVFPPLVRFELPVSGYLYGVEYDLVDTHGNPVPRHILHHFNLIDPEHREMFLPISRRVFAAGQETGSYQMPKTLAGVPFEQGDSWILSVMLHNPTDQVWEGIQLKVRLRTVRRGLPWPLANVIPFQMDTLFPTGGKSFDVPPGESSRSWEGSPVSEGRIIAIGSHLHEMATRIYLEDVTEGQIVWSGSPVYDDDGRLEATTRGEFFGSFGVLIKPDHVYKVTVDYLNPTGMTIPSGGMGVIAGLIIPADPDFDFSSNPSDSLYVDDKIHFMREGMAMETNDDSDMDTGGNRR